MLLSICLLVLLGSASAADDPLSSFPEGFIFGSATASYQVEGAYQEGGRGFSIWDNFSHTPGKTYMNETGDVADDHYHRYRDDIALMASLGLQHYRMSISWTRIYPNTTSQPPNQAGIAFYKNLFLTLQNYSITPYVTLFHWDSPQSLEDAFGGWRDPRMVDAYAQYARTCFQEFGEFVRHWFTFNEPLTFTTLGYGDGHMAPGRCSVCSQGNSSTEPYLVGHHILLAHAQASHIYRTEFQRGPDGKGIVAMVTNCDFVYPQDDASSTDKAAAEVGLQFECGWWNDPLFFGDYPASMRQALGQRLPTFTVEQSQLLRGSSDVIALNHYSSRYATPQTPCSVNDLQWSWNQEACIQLLTTDKQGNPIGPVAASSWLYVVPRGLRSILQWVSARYNRTAIYVTENGVSEENEGQNAPNLNDTWRVDFYTQYIGNLSWAITKDGVDVRGYFAWSLMDNFEWADGYSKRFGLIYVDFRNGSLQRILKASATWYAALIQRNARRAPTKQDDGLTAGQTAGIIISVLAFVAFLVYGYVRVQQTPSEDVDPKYKSYGTNN